eukprot:4768587-Pleurochrysis_carterae.AAC.3
MNRVAQSSEVWGARRIGKSSDPDHPFHPCDDVDSDDPVIEALLDSSSSQDRSCTKCSELDYDPAYPYRDPFESQSIAETRTCPAEFEQQ